MSLHPSTLQCSGLKLTLLSPHRPRHRYVELTSYSPHKDRYQDLRSLVSYLKARPRVASWISDLPSTRVETALPPPHTHTHPGKTTPGLALALLQQSQAHRMVWAQVSMPILHEATPESGGADRIHQLSGSGVSGATSSGLMKQPWSIRGQWRGPRRTLWASRSSGHEGGMRH